MTSGAPTPRERKPASVRRTEILDAAAAEFADNGFSGTRLETIAARADISHPRIIQMFGTKQALFLAVLDEVFNLVSSEFAACAAKPAAGAQSAPLVAMGDAYRRLLQRDTTVALVMLQSYAAAGNGIIRDAVAKRYLQLQRQVADLTGADSLAGANLLRNRLYRHGLDGARTNHQAR